jgi:PBP1b-binding outer membrane lipoprotein LpoB
MKKVFSIIAVAALATSFVSCGPSAEEKAKMEERAKFMQDSIANAINASMETATEAAPVDTAAAAPAAPAEEAHH